MDERMNVLGQAIYDGNDLEPRPVEFELWLEQGLELAKRHLLQRAKELRLDTSLINEDPLTTIDQVYGNGSPLYRKFKHEAFRVSQLIYYYYLNHADQLGFDSIDMNLSYTFSIGVQMVHFANMAECHLECLASAKNAMSVYQENHLDQWTKAQGKNFREVIESGLFLIGYDATKSALKIQRFYDALDWAIQTEPNVAAMDNAFLVSDYWFRKGEALIGLGNAEEGLATMEKATQIPGQTVKELNDVQMRLKLARAEVIGDINMVFGPFLERVSKDSETNRLEQLSKAAFTGNANWDDLGRGMDIMKEFLSDPSLEMLEQDTSQKGLSAILKRDGKQLVVSFARVALTRDDIAYVESVMPQLEELADSDSAFALDAALFLARVRLYKGQALTGESLLSMVSRMASWTKTPILNYFGDLLAIITGIDEQALEKAMLAITSLLREYTFDHEDEENITAVVQDTAMRSGDMSAFLTLSALMAEYEPENTDFWLSRVSRFKTIFSYRGQRVQKESELFRFSSLLPTDTVSRVRQKVETLTRHCMETEGGVTTKSREIENDIKILLYPLYKKSNPSPNEKESGTLYPEILHIETSSFVEIKGRDEPVISIIYNDNKWCAYHPEAETNIHYILDYQNFLKGQLQLDYIIKEGMKFRSTLLPIPFDSKSPSLIGVRSTGIYHRLPLDSLPLAVDGSTGRIHWVGEKTTTVLLTGPNKDLAILEKTLLLESIALFVNTDFGGKFRCLKGTSSEVNAIADIVKTKTAVSLKIFRECESNRDNFLQLSGEKAPQIMHIATHGIVSEENPSASFIALSNKDSAGNSILGAVGYYDILLMDLRQCDLVVLSACSTHEGESILGEGVMGLAWAFKAAGAKAVIGTRWPVDDKAAVAFWSTFYEHVGNGLSIAKAFQAARLFIMNHHEWNHPYYWGVFQLIV